MLDERQMECIGLRFQGLNVTDTAAKVGISRTTYYEWCNTEEYKAEAFRREREYISTTKQATAYYAPKALKGLIWLAEYAVSEKVRLEAYSKLLDKVISNAVKIELSNGNDDQDSISQDLLNEELNEFDNA